MTTRIYGFNQFVQTDHFNLNFLKFSNSGLGPTKDICLAGWKMGGNHLHEDITSHKENSI